MKRIVEFAHDLLTRNIKEGDTVVDATCGNGYDTVFLAKLTGSQGKIYACDIQLEAIESTRNHAKDFDNITYIHDNHAQVTSYIDEEKIDGAIFNLGYLPKSNKDIITLGHSTIKSIDSMLELLNPKKLIVIVIYHGHEGGKDEKNQVLNYVEQLNHKKYSVIRYSFINQHNNPPFVVAIEKRK